MRSPTSKHHQSSGLAMAAMDTKNDNAGEMKMSKMVFSISCPDGSNIRLSSTNSNGGSGSGNGSGRGSSNGDDSSSSVIIGRGEHGIPLTASHVNRRACALRLVQQYSGGGGTRATTTTTNSNDTQYEYAMELVVLGSQPCRITRKRSGEGVSILSTETETIVLKNITDLLARKYECSPSIIRLRDGDVIEPYDRSSDCTVEEAKANGIYHPFQVSISHGVGSEIIEKTLTHASISVEVANKAKSNENGNAVNDVVKPTGQDEENQNFAQAIMGKQTKEKLLDANEGSKSKGLAVAAELTVANEIETAEELVTTDDMEVEVNHEVKVLPNNADKEMTGQAKEKEKETAQILKELTDKTKQSESEGMDVDRVADDAGEDSTEQAKEKPDVQMQKEDSTASNNNSRSSEESLQQAKDTETPAAQMPKKCTDAIEHNNASGNSSKRIVQSSGEDKASAITTTAEVFGEASKVSKDVVATDDGMGEGASASASHYLSSNTQNQLTQGYIPGPVPLAHNHSTHTNADTPQQQPLTWIYPSSTNSSYSERQYQLEITRTALSYNTLVSLPTGLGKSFIAAVVMYNYYRWFPTGKVVFLAPTYALVNQQIQTFYNIMGIPESHTAKMSGKNPRKERGRLWKERRLLFSTPQTMESDLKSDNCDGNGKKVVCIVLDKAHKAVKEYAYVKILQQLNKCGARFRLLALSATPGKDIATTQTVIQTLNVSRIEARLEEEEEVKQYAHTVQKEIVYLDPTKDVHADAAPLSIEDTKRNNPKLQKVDEMLREHFERARARGKGDTKAIIFSTLRESVQEIVNVLQSAAPLVRAVKFVGRNVTNKDKVEDVADGDNDNATATGKKSFTSSKKKGMTSDEQASTVRDFRAGIHNVLVCTSIGEEGLDIGATDLIINFDCLRSPLQVVQREGLTGRSHAGRVVCLVYRGQEEKKLFESEAQTQTLWRALRNTNGFHLAKNVPLLPEKPVLERRDMQVRRNEYRMSQTGGLTQKAKKSEKERNDNGKGSVEEYDAGGRRLTESDELGRQEQFGTLHHLARGQASAITAVDEVSSEASKVSKDVVANDGIGDAAFRGKEKSAAQMVKECAEIIEQNKAAIGSSPERTDQSSGGGQTAVDEVMGEASKVSEDATVEVAMHEGSEVAVVTEGMGETASANANEESIRQGKEVPAASIEQNVMGNSSKSTDQSSNMGQTTTNSESNQCGKPVEIAKDQSKALMKDSHTSSAEESSEEEYDVEDPRQEIIEILEDVESPGAFVIGGSCDGKLIMPGLEVEGLGPIGLPLSPNVAKDLVQRCEQAPFGRGSKTIVDKTVRNTFQLEPEHFKVTNPSWSEELDSLTKQVCQGLGVEAHLKVEARIYKLLVYEEGSFFAPHRDSEKEEGMFGTLVVVLPSHFSGGELVVKHKGDTETFEQGALSKFESQYAAFYADCKHELKKVTAGHRLCLVYNLVKVGLGSRPSAADNCAVMKRLRNAARLWGKEYDNNKVVRMTDHYYTPAGIRLGDSSKYKGSDAALVQLLDLAIEKGVDIDYDYGQVSLSESGTGELECYGYRTWGNDNYCWDETYDRSISLKLSIWGSMNIDEEEEMVPPDYFEDKVPTNETFEPTGNAGVEAERQYDDAGAIVIWPRSQRWRVVTRNDTSKMCDYLLKACREGTPDSEPREECIKKANIILPRFKDNCSLLNVKNMMKCIITIGDETLAKRFLTSYIASNSTKTPHALMEHLQTFIDCFGSNVVNPIFLTSINSTRFRADPSDTATFLINYCNTIGLKTSNKQLTENLVDAFVDLMSPPDKTGRIAPNKSLDTFPLNGILGLFIAGNYRNSGTLVKRILEGYVWMSCQKISEPYRYHSYSTGSAAPKGPIRLLTAALFLVRLCEKFGWKENEVTFVEASKALSLYGNADIAVALIEKISSIAMSSPGQICERSRICAQMSSVACEKILATLQKSATLDTCKKLFRIIGKYCPSFAPRFTQSAKQLDVSSVLYPLVTDNALRAATTDVMQGSLRLLTNHCASVLNSRISGYLGTVAIWTVPNAHHSKNSRHATFLKSPCMKKYDEKVRKSDHNGFFRDLAPFIKSGEIKAESYQPGGRGAYHFKITKLKSRRVPMASLVSLSCSCDSYRYSSYRSYRPYQQPSECLLIKYKERLSKYNDDKRKLCVVEALLAPEQQSQLGSCKRSANPYASSTAAADQINPFAGTVRNPYRASASTSTPAVRNPYRSSSASTTANASPSFSAITTTNASSTSSANASVSSIARAGSNNGPRGQVHGQPAAKKQKTLPEVVNLLDDDDEVQIEGVLDLRQAIHKRVKEAESKGEIIEIS